MGTVSTEKTEKAPAKPRAKRPSYDRRYSDILNSAVELILERGYESISMMDVAERIGVAEGTVYRYFSSKDELLIKATELWYTASFSDKIDIAAVKGTYSRLRYLIWHSLNNIKAGAPFSRFVFVEMRPRHNYKQSHIFNLMRGYTSEIRKALHSAIENGDFQSDVSEKFLRDMIFGGIEHATWRFLRGEGDFDPDVIADEMTTVVFRGMSSQRSAADEFAVISSQLELINQRLSRIEEGK